MQGLDLATFASVVSAYGYFAIYPISVLEGPMIAVFSGFLASLGLLNPVIVLLVLLAGDATGDFLYYMLGKWSKHGLIHRIFKFMGSDDEKLKKMEKYYEKHNWKIIAFSKTQALGSPFLIAAGIAGMPFDKYITYALLGSVPKVLIFTGIGYFFGSSIASVGKYIDFAGIASAVIAVVLIVVYFIYKRYIKSLSSKYFNEI